MDFDGIVRSALDFWSEESLDNGPDSLIKELFGLAARPGRIVHCVDLTPSYPADYLLRTIGEQTDRCRTGTIRLGDHPDQTFIRSHVLGAYCEAKVSAHPIIDSVSSKVKDRYYLYDRIILPQRRKSGEPADWALGLIQPRLILPIPQKRPQITEIELTILQNLMTGEQPKEIAPQVKLTRRAVEHRIQALKTKYGARNVTHLVSLAITAGLLGSS